VHNQGEGILDEKLRSKTKGGQSAAFAVFILPRAPLFSILQILPRQVPEDTIILSGNNQTGLVYLPLLILEYGIIISRIVVEFKRRTS